MSAASRALLGCVLLACAGCAVQLGGAGHLDAQSGDRGVAVNTTARLQRPRGHGAFGGGHLTFGALGDDGVGLRSLVLTGGNRWAWRGFALEIGIEGGVGQPVVERFDGTGLYAGALASPMLRLSGSTDTDVGFAPGAVLIDLRRFPLLPPGGAAEPGRDFPAIAPIVLARIGNGLIATLPTEATTVAGLRIREGILDVVASMQAPAPEDVAIVGLAQEYMQYTATAEEYEVQLYEGASTLYGPATAAFLADQHRCLAERVLLGRDDAACRRGQERLLDQVGDVGYDPAPEATRLHDLADVHPPQARIQLGLYLAVHNPSRQTTSCATQEGTPRHPGTQCSSAASRA